MGSNSFSYNDHGKLSNFLCFVFLIEKSSKSAAITLNSNALAAYRCKNSIERKIIGIHPISSVWLHIPFLEFFRSLDVNSFISFQLKFTLLKCEWHKGSSRTSQFDSSTLVSPQTASLSSHKLFTSIPIKCILRRIYVYLCLAAKPSTSFFLI